MWAIAYEAMALAYLSPDLGCSRDPFRQTQVGNHPTWAGERSSAARVRGRALSGEVAPPHPPRSRASTSPHGRGKPALPSTSSAVMAGPVPAIHVFNPLWFPRRGWPGRARP